MAHALKTPFYSFPRCHVEGRSAFLVCRIAEDAARCTVAAYVADKFRIFQNLRHFFSNTPIDLYGRRGGGWQNPAPRSDSRLTKSMLSSIGGRPGCKGKNGVKGGEERERSNSRVDE